MAAEEVTSRKSSFKEKQFQVREDAILDVVNRLLATKGYDLMTIDEIAAEVGIAKASVYKHFESKEEVAAAAMTRLLDRTLGVMGGLDPDLPPVEKMRAIVRWSVETHLRGEMPLLPSTRSTIRQALIGSRAYLERLTQVTTLLTRWIVEGQQDGSLSPRLPPEMILYTLFARSCDPVADFLQLGGAFSNEQIVDFLLQAWLTGIAPADR